MVECNVVSRESLMRYTAVTSEPYIHNVIRRGEYRRSLTATISTNNQMIASVFENLNKICRYPLLVPLIVVRASVKYWEIDIILQ